MRTGTTVATAIDPNGGRANARDLPTIESSLRGEACFGGSCRMGIMSMSTVVGLLAATLTVAPAPAEESAWIVETAPGAVETVAAVAEDLGDAPVETFDDAFSGVAVDLTDAEAGMLEQRPDVVAVHPDVEMTLLDTQTSAPWHLSRLDQATAPADGSYSYPASAGTGVRVYVVDSGISPNPGQLGSRLLPGVSALTGDASTADCQGHGTHVAGIVASTTYGVAKKASVVPVRVFSCSGSTSSSTVISGLNWIAANHPAGTPGIVNMSLGGPASSPLDTAVQNLITRGLIVTVAAGNGGDDRIGDNACLESPARVPAALTVGATTTTDARAVYSNFGTCLDLFAPGSAVRSLSHTDASSSIMMSGTSMATPVVAGVAALAWAEAPGTSARQVEADVVAQARTGVVGSPGSGSPNRLANAVTSPSVPVASPPSTPTTGLREVYRFYSEQLRSHLFTSSPAERDFIRNNFPAQAWRFEGVAFNAFGSEQPGTVPLYRFYSSTRGTHLFTASPAEKLFIETNYPSAVWKYEGIAFWAYPRDHTGSDPIYRFFSPVNNAHFFTSSSNEADYIRRTFPLSAWTYEGIAFRIPRG